jgi:hypothetical protein
MRIKKIDANNYLWIAENKVHLNEHENCAQTIDAQRVGIAFGSIATVAIAWRWKYTHQYAKTVIDDTKKAEC